MRKILTLCLSLVIGLSSVYAGNPQPKPQRTILPSLNKASHRPMTPSLQNAQSLGGQSAQSTLPGVFNYTTTGVLKSVTTNKSKKLAAPAKIGASGSTIYGNVTYDAANLAGALGLAEVFLDGTLKHVEPALITSNMKKMNPVMLQYVRDNKMYVMGMDFYDGFITMIGDLSTGEIERIPHENVTNWQFASYDVFNDVVRGYVYDGVHVYFGYAPGYDPNDFTATGVFDMNTLPKEGFNVIASTYNSKDKKFLLFFGPKSDNDIYEADLTNDNLTKVGTLDVPCTYITGVTYSDFDGGYVFGLCTDELCALQILDRNTFEVKAQTDYPDLFEFGWLECMDDHKIASAAPDLATLVSFDFPEGALTGTVTYKMSPASVSGTPILGNVNWILYVDGQEVKRGTAAAGSEVTIDVPTLEEGYHTFRLRQATGSNYGPDTKDITWIGYDTPVAPASVDLTANTITWTPVDAGIHDGYVNPEEITYNVYLNDELLAKDVKGTSWATGLAADVVINNFVASVEAVFDGKVSAPTYSNSITYGESANVPCAFLPTPQEVSLFTIVNPEVEGVVQNDDITFYNGPYYRYGTFSGFQYYAGYKENYGAYLFLPPINFEDAKTVYEFSAEIFRGNENYEESFEIVLATAPNAESVVKTIVPEKSVILLADGMDREVYTEVTDFTVPTAGVYYLAVHPTSHRGERINMTNFKVDVAKDFTPASPAFVNNLTVTPGAQGALNATVSFNIPTENVSGEVYTANDVLTVSLQATGCDEVTVTGKPGEAKTVVVPTAQGDNIIKVLPIKDNVKGVPSELAVYTGVYRPYIPTNIKATVGDDNFSVTLSWDPPTEADFNPSGHQIGDYVAPTGMKYYLAIDRGNYWDIGAFIGTDVYTCNLVVTPGIDQTVTRLGVIAENVAGMSDHVAQTMAVVGKPFEMPFTHNFYESQNVSPIINYDEKNVSMFYGDPAGIFSTIATPDKLNALFPLAWSNVTAMYSLPKFSTKGAQHGAVELYTYGGACESFSVCAKAPGMDTFDVIATYTPADFETTGPQRVRVELPAKFQNKGWVEPYIIYTVKSFQTTFPLYAFRYIDNLAADFGVTAVSGTKSAAIGEEAKFTATVMNFGHDDTNFPGASWILTNEAGQVLAEVAVPAGNEAVASETSFENEISFTPTADDLGKLYLAYTINEGDEKAANNTMTVEINVIPGQTPVVTDLSASEISHDHVTLDWTEPSGVSSTEDIENEEPYLSEDDTNKIGDFTRVDSDGEPVYYFNNQAFAALEIAGRPSSFTVYSQKHMEEEVFGAPNILQAHSGDLFLVAICPGTGESPEPAANDWLISPEVAPGSVVSFYAKALTYAYGNELIEVRYSTSGSRPRDFKEVLGTVVLSGDPNEIPAYDQYSFKLPADAKYFAIHYITADVFGICLDDITYVPADAETLVNGYDIFRDGSLAESTDGSAAGYVDNNVKENTNYVYTVMPKLAAGGNGIESNKLSIRTTGINGVLSGKVVYSAGGVIVVKGYEGEAVSIVSADGIVRYASANASDNVSFEATPGIYVVKAGKETFKLTVH